MVLCIKNELKFRDIKFVVGLLVLVAISSATGIRLWLLQKENCAD
jgi:hypothetical protein